MNHLMCLWTSTRKITDKKSLWMNLHLGRVNSNILQLTERSDLITSGFKQTVRQKNRNEDFAYFKFTLLIKESTEQQS